MSELKCKGDNCNAKRGIGHSGECIKEHEETASVDVVELFSGTLDALNELSIIKKESKG